MVLSMTLGERISTARNKLGISQLELAARCGWGASRIGNYEQDLREPTLAELRIIAKNLKESGYTPAWIVLGEDVSQPVRIDEGILAVAIEKAKKSKTGIRADKVIALYEMLVERNKRTVVDLPPTPIGKPPNEDGKHGADKRGNRGTEGTTGHEGHQLPGAKSAS